MHNRKSSLYLYGISISLFLLFTSLCSAQTKTIEKLREALQSSSNPSEKSDRSSHLAEALYSHDLAEGFSYATQALQLAHDAAYPLGIAQASTSLGNYYFFTGDIALSGSYYQRALVAAKGAKLEGYPAATYLQLSNLQRVKANFDSALYFIRQSERYILKGNTDLEAQLLKCKGLLANARSHNDLALYYLKKSTQISKSTKDSITLADTWRVIGTVFKDMSSYDSSYFYYDKSQQIADLLQEPVIRMLLSLNRGETDFSIGAFEVAIDNYSKALNLLKEHNYKFYYAISLFKIGEVYENEGVYNTAFEYFYNSLKEHEKLSARQEIQRTYSQIGWCYAYQENYPQAQENAQRSLDIAREIRDSSSIGQNQNLLGYIYYKTKKYEAARRSFDQAISIRKTIKDWYGYSFSLYNSALTYLEIDNTKKAHDLFLESIEVDKRIGKKIGILFTSNTLGLQYAKEKNFVKAAHYLAEANTLAKQIPVPTQLLSNYDNYIFLYEAQNKSGKAIEYYKRYTQLKDSLSNKINSSRIAKADALFQLQKKANEIQLINRENDLHQEMIQIQKREISFQRLLIGLAVFSILLLAVFIVLIYRLFRSNKRAKEQLRLQNSSILEQQGRINAQSEELRATNDKLESINDSLEKRVEERTSELNKAYNELETFFYHTSHDFRRPLTTYLGLVELGKATVKDEGTIQLFDKVKETTLALDNMLIKLQSISNSNHHEVSRDIDLKMMLQTCVEKFNDDIKKSNLKVSIHTQVTHVFASSFLLSVVAENLIENAIRFCLPGNPELVIKTQRGNNGLEITFQDNGQGIEESLKPRIFEMYFRANTQSTGNGLGLYIAKRAIEKMGGDLTFKSQLNEGSCFTVSLPSD